MANYFEHDDLLEPPVKRAAFSDRTAYLMAEMSRLAYFKFEGGANIDELLQKASEFIVDKEKLLVFEQLLKSTVVTSTAVEAEQMLAEILALKGFELVRTFNEASTGVQCFLCRNVKQNLAILAFRGTEKNLADIRTDVKANLRAVYYGRDNKKVVAIHSGYYKQYVSIEIDLKKTLESETLQGYQLFVTGHSLGGALAITTIKFLASDSTGACYTFGSPPVGTNKFDEDIKTPIYRIINYVDIVPRLPNPYLVGVLRVAGLLMEFVLSPMGKVYNRIAESKLYRKIDKFLVDAGQYRQSGYGSYLVGKSSSVILRYNVMFYDKAIWWLYQCKNLFRGNTEILSDHNIELYSQLLANWAESRNTK